MEYKTELIKNELGILFARIRYPKRQFNIDSPLWITALDANTQDFYEFNVLDKSVVRWIAPVDADHATLLESAKARFSHFGARFNRQTEGRVNLYHCPDNLLFYTYDEDTKKTEWVHDLRLPPCNVSRKVKRTNQAGRNLHQGNRISGVDPDRPRSDVLHQGHQGHQDYQDATIGQENARMKGTPIHARSRANRHTNEEILRDDSDNVDVVNEEDPERLNPMASHHDGSTRDSQELDDSGVAQNGGGTDGSPADSRPAPRRKRFINPYQGAHSDGEGVAERQGGMHSEQNRATVNMNTQPLQVQGVPQSNMTAAQTNHPNPSAPEPNTNPAQQQVAATKSPLVVCRVCCLNYPTSDSLRRHTNSEAHRRRAEKINNWGKYLVDEVSYPKKVKEWIRRCMTAFKKGPRDADFVHKFLNQIYDRLEYAEKRSELYMLDWTNEPVPNPSDRNIIGADFVDRFVPLPINGEPVSINGNQAGGSDGPDDDDNDDDGSGNSDHVDLLDDKELVPLRENRASKLRQAEDLQQVEAVLTSAGCDRIPSNATEATSSYHAEPVNGIHGALKHEKRAREPSSDEADGRPLEKRSRSADEQSGNSCQAQQNQASLASAGPSNANVDQRVEHISERLKSQIAVNARRARSGLPASDLDTRLNDPALMKVSDARAANLAVISEAQRFCDSQPVESLVRAAYVSKFPHKFLPRFPANEAKLWNRQLWPEYQRSERPPNSEAVQSKEDLENRLSRAQAKFQKGVVDSSWLLAQLRSISDDLWHQKIEDIFTVRIYENRARLAIAESAVEELGVSLSVLHELYRTVHSVDEGDFQSYHILYCMRSGKDPELRQLVPDVAELAVIKNAIRIYRIFQRNDFYGFFKLFPTQSDENKRIMDFVMPKLRSLALVALQDGFSLLNKKSSERRLGRSGEQVPTIPLVFLQQLFRISDPETCKQVLRDYGAVFTQAGDMNLAESDFS